MSNLEVTDWQTIAALGDALGVSRTYLRTIAGTDTAYEGYTIEGRDVRDDDDVHHATKRLYRAVEADQPESREELLAELAGAEARIEELEAAAAGQTHFDGAEELAATQEALESAQREIGRLQDERDEAEAEVERQREMREEVKAERDELENSLQEAARLRDKWRKEAARQKEFVQEYESDDYGDLRPIAVALGVPPTVKHIVQRIEELEAHLDTLTDKMDADSPGRAIEYAERLRIHLHQIGVNVGLEDGEPLQNAVAKVVGLKEERDTLKRTPARRKADHYLDQLNSIEERLNKHPLSKLVLKAQRARESLPQWVSVFLNVAQERIDELERTIPTGENHKALCRIRDLVDGDELSLTEIAARVGSLKIRADAAVDGQRDLKVLLDRMQEAAGAASWMEAIEELEDPSLCLAVSSDGTRCLRKLNPVKYCHLHDPINGSRAGADPTPIINAAWDLVIAVGLSSSDMAGLLDKLGKALRAYYVGGQ